MKNITFTHSIYTSTLTSIIICFCNFLSFSQIVDENDKMEPKIFNYTKFTNQTVPVVTDELIKLTPEEFHSHPEFGILPYGAPCEDCFELIHERKDSERMFVKKGTNGSYFYSQGIYGSYHYEENGQKISYDPRLKPVSANLYRSNRQETPTVLNVNDRYSAFERNGEFFRFNNRIELILIKNNGTNENLGEANWSDHTVGDEGIYIKNAWQGIDITISYQQDRIKLNYIIPQPLNYLSDVNKLIFADNIQLPNGYSMMPENTNDITSDGYIGKYIVRDFFNQEAFIIDKAFAFDQSGEKENSIFLNYTFAEGSLNISMPKSWLSSGETVYPVVIDPLVTTTTIYGPGTMNFRYNGDFCSGPNGACTYTLQTSRPLNSTLTDVHFNILYNSSGSCWMSEAGFRIGGPCATTGFFSCGPPGGNSAGDCFGTNISIFNETSDCTTPVCSAVLTYTMENSYCWSSTSGCASSCQVMPANAWSVTVEGRTIETPSVTNVTPPACSGGVTLNAAPNYGVPGFTYLWNTGATSSSISTASTGTYSVVVTDACGIQATQQFNVACPLGISLKDFNVVRAGKDVLVKWETSNEYNNDFFTIERMTDNKNWEIIGTVKGSQNSVEDIVYKFYDKTPHKRGISYYRLKQTDFDGEYFYFDPKAIDFSNDEIRIFPQPATNELIIEWNGFNGEVFMYSLLGEKISLPVTKEGISYILNTSHVSPGVYSIVLSIDGEILSTQKVVIR